MPTPKMAYLQQRSESRVATILGLYAVVLAIAIFFYCFYIPQTPGRQSRISAELISALPLWKAAGSLAIPGFQNSSIVALLLIFFALLTFIIYGLAVRLCWDRDFSKTCFSVIVIASVGYFLLASFSLPNLNTDIYHYITRARVAAVHHSNPHYIPSDAFPDDPIYAFASQRWTGLVGDKLALWTLISIPLARLAGDHPVTNLLVFRLAFCLFNLANLALIALILRRWKPRFILAGLVFYAWNPIIAIQGPSKTDTVMVFFLLLAALLLLYKFHRSAVVAMALSVLIKLMTLPLVAFYFLRQLKMKMWREFAVGVGLFSLTVVVINLPFWEGASLITSHLDVAIGESGSTLPGLVRYLSIAIFFLFFIWLARMQDGGHEKLLLAWSLVALFMSIFLVRVYNSWYHTMLIAVVSVVLEWRVTLLTFALTFSAFMFNTWYSTFTKDFRPPELFALPTRVVYFAPAVCILAVMALIFFVKRKRLKTKQALIVES